MSVKFRKGLYYFNKIVEGNVKKVFNCISKLKQALLYKRNLFCGLYIKMILIYLSDNVRLLKKRKVSYIL